MPSTPRGAVFMAAIACLAGAAFAADPSAAGHARKHGAKMKMDEPMATGMMKKGMMKGDVKHAADKKAQTLQPMMEQEEKTMPPADKAKP